MARSRNIKPGFFEDDELSEASKSARLLFIGMWTICDRRGILEDRPKKIKGQVFPYDDDTVDQINAQIEELNKLGYVIRYEADGVKLIFIKGFSKNQNPHPKEAESKFLPPTQENITSNKLATTLQQPLIAVPCILNIESCISNNESDSQLPDDINNVVSDIPKPTPTKILIDPSFVQSPEFSEGIEKELAMIIQDLDQNNYKEKSGENWKFLATLINEGLDVETLKKAIKNHTSRNASGDDKFKSRFKNSFDTIQSINIEATREDTTMTDEQRQLKELFGDED